MPIIIPKALPSFQILSDENIFVMTKKRAMTQDIRPIEVAIVNLMPTKVVTETQLLRLLGNTSLQLNPTFIRTGSYQSKNTAIEYLEKYYTTVDELNGKKFDAMIITGAPVETIPFEEVLYWKEMKEILEFAKENVTSTMFICWGAQAGLYYHYGINKFELQEKMFGIFPYSAEAKFDPLLKGMDDVFHIPMSRHTSIDEDAVRNNPNLTVLANNKEHGISILKSIDNKMFFMLGHSEYDRDTLKTEYLRDLNKGLHIKSPYNYFVNDDIDDINMCWSSTANLIYYNWINHYVYQVTPFNFIEGGKQLN